MPRSPTPRHRTTITRGSRTGQLMGYTVRLKRSGPGKGTKIGFGKMGRAGGKPGRKRYKSTGRRRLPF